MIIIGAGMAGLLAAAMLRDEASVVIEKQKDLPNNHSAVLRFRTAIVGDALNIPFKPVQVMRAVHPWRNPIADAMAYSRKTNGFYNLRSITSIEEAMVKRYISPDDFIDRMRAKVQCRIDFDSEFNWSSRDNVDPVPIISTMPMPALMKALGWEAKSEFKGLGGVNIVSRIDGLDAYFSLYVPDPNFAGSRISAIGDRLVVECYMIPKDALSNPKDFYHYQSDLAMGYCGIDLHQRIDTKVSNQHYGKILPIDEDERKRFILWATEKHNVYSLGRFATWRPGLLLDDVVNDVRQIHRMIHGESSYRHRL